MGKDKVAMKTYQGVKEDHHEFRISAMDEGEIAARPGCLACQEIFYVHCIGSRI